MRTNVGVVCAHPDDEVLGCGGTIARYAEAGHAVHVLIMAEGATSRGAERDALSREGEIRRLRDAARSAASVLGTRSVTFAGYPDNRMDGVPLLDIAKQVEQFLEENKISVVLTHHGADLNVDHRMVHQAVAIACRPLPLAIIQTVLCFEVPSSTEWQLATHPPFTATWFENVESTLARKLAALRCYEMEMRPAPHPRSYEAVEALARWRGATVGRLAAEAFQVLRHIDG